MEKVLFPILALEKNLQALISSKILYKIRASKVCIFES